MALVDSPDWQPQDPSISIPGFEPLTKIPLEVRSLIYNILYPFNEFIIISSPVKWKRFQSPKLTSLLRTSKNIYGEASPVLYKAYTHSTFVFGNLEWGSTTQPNLQGEKSFFKHITVQHRARVRKVKILIHFNNNLWQRNDGREHLIQGNFKGAGDAVNMVRRLSKVLQGLESVELFNPRFRGESFWQPNSEHVLGSQTHPVNIPTPSRKLSENMVACDNMLSVFLKRNTIKEVTMPTSMEPVVRYLLEHKKYEGRRDICRFLPDDELFVKMGGVISIIGMDGTRQRQRWVIWPGCATSD